MSDELIFNLFCEYCGERTSFEVVKVKIQGCVLKCCCCNNEKEGYYKMRDLEPYLMEDFE